MTRVLDLQRLIKQTIIVAVLASIANEVLALVGNAISSPPDTFGPYMASRVVGFTVLGVIAAACVYVIVRALVRDVARTNRYFFIISVIALIVSFYPDLIMPYSTDADDIGWTWGIIWNLMLMHVVAAAFVLAYIPQKK